MNNKNLKCCIIGSSGHWSMCVDNSYNVEFVGVSAGSDGERIGNVVSKFDKIAIYDDYIKMINELKPDFCIVDCYIGDHFRVTMDVLKLGCHVLCDKPICINDGETEETDIVYNYAKNNGLYVLSMHSMRYEDYIFAAREVVLSGEIGEICMMNAQKSYKMGNRPAFYSKRETYGGTIPWIGTHAFDLIYWFSGKRFREVSAYHNILHNNGNGEMESVVVCSILLEENIPVTVNLDFKRPQSAGTHGDDRLRIVGSEGVLEIIGGESVLINKNGKQILKPKSTISILDDFINGINGLPTVLNSEDCRYINEFCLVARNNADVHKNIIS